MSNMGLYSGLYDQIRSHAALFDEVLVGLRSGDSTPSDPARQRLANLLLAVATNPASDFSLRALDIALRDGQVGDKRIWVQVARALQAPEVEPAMVARLEQMALALEAERTGTLARMRRWSR
jgi:hypothetical protein